MYNVSFTFRPPTLRATEKEKILCLWLQESHLFWLAIEVVWWSIVLETCPLRLKLSGGPLKYLEMMEILYTLRLKEKRCTGWEASKGYLCLFSVTCDHQSQLWYTRAWDDLLGITLFVYWFVFEFYLIHILNDVKIFSLIIIEWVKLDGLSLSTVS